MRLEKRIKVLALLALGLALSLPITMVWGTPTSPTSIEVTQTSRREEAPAATIEAQAGNVTEISISASVVTQSWAGYYGNVSGTIVLDDALNNSLYQWDLNELVGEVFAARDTVDFSTSNIICANITHIEDEETNLSIASTSKDGVNETFIHNTHPSFSVGANVFSANDCNYTASTYVNNATDPSRTFNETLLFDITNDQVVYTALLTNNQDGFKIGNDLYDFQMLVGEDGHSNTETTPYYFYVELEP